MATSKTNIFYNPTFRSVVFQILAVAGLAFFFYTIVNNALSNLEARGLLLVLIFLSRSRLWHWFNINRV